MKIVVFGASGGTGKKIVEQALSQGHIVIAFIRTPSKLELQHQNLTIVQGDVLDANSVKAAMAGQNAVISALAPTKPAVSGMMETAAKNIVAAMQSNGMQRLISTTGAGVRDPQDRPKLIDHVMKSLLTILAGNVLRDSAANADVIRSSDLDWTIARFPRLTNGIHTGKYRVGYVNKDSGWQISRADAADFILNELTANRWIKKAPLVSN
jgi:putative NADH-flavin reductase